MMAVLVRDSTRSVVVNELAFALFAATECTKCLQCVVDTVDQWTREHYVYVSDGDEMEMINTPAYDIQQIANGGSFEGDCDDVSIFVAAMFACLGMNTRFVAIRMEPDAPYTHVFVETLAGDHWAKVDCTVPLDTVHYDAGRMVVYV
jgi:hypothetical protein